MSKNQELETLFAEWIAERRYERKFKKDGIVDEELWNITSPKILFIAKEPNDPGQKAGDYRSWWKEPLDNTFSYRIADWAFGILNGFPEYDRILESAQTRENAIRSIAFMNIKKIGGGASSNQTEISNFLRTDQFWINKEIEIIDPEIIITGVSWPQLRNQLFPGLLWKDTGYQIQVARNGGKRIIDFYHPSSLMPASGSYSLLQNVFHSKAFYSL